MSDKFDRFDDIEDENYENKLMSLQKEAEDIESELEVVETRIAINESLIALCKGQTTKEKTGKLIVDAFTKKYISADDAIEFGLQMEMGLKLSSKKT